MPSHNREVQLLGGQKMYNRLAFGIYTTHTVRAVELEVGKSRANLTGQNRIQIEQACQNKEPEITNIMRLGPYLHPHAL